MSNSIITLDEHNKNIINKRNIEKERKNKHYPSPALKCNRCDGRYFYENFFEGTGVGSVVICDKCGDRDYML